MSVRKAIQDILLWRGLNFLSVFILNVLVARLLEASQAGSLFFFINNLSLLILLLSFSAEAGMGYYAASGKIAAARLGTLALLWCAAATVISFVLFNGIAVYLSPVNGIDAKQAAVFFIGGSLLISFYSALFFARENFFIPNLCLLLVNIVLIVLFVAGTYGLITPQWLLYFYFAGFLIQGLAIAMFYFFSIGNQRYGLPAVTELRDILRYTAASFLSNLLFFLVYRVDYWFVETYCTAQQLGNYIQVSKIVQWLLLVPMMIGTALFPLTAAGKENDMAVSIVSVSRFLFWLYLLVCLAASLCGYWLFPWLFGDSYQYMYPVFLLHIPGILALAALYPVSAYHAGIKKVSINLKGSLLALLLIVLLNIVFTPRYGIYAASVASSAGYCLYFIFSLYFFNRHNRIGRYNFFKPVRSDYAFLRSLLYKRK